MEDKMQGQHKMEKGKKVSDGGKDAANAGIRTDYFDNDALDVRFDGDVKVDRKAKDSVFTSLFRKPKYRYQLYLSLHPEDVNTKEEDLTLMTLESHLLNQQYNDLGFMVRDRLIILVEEQSSWSENIVVRTLLYMTQTWYKYIKRTEQNLYGSRRVKLPVPELYVIYTGRGAETKPASMSLREIFFEGSEVCIDCEVRILTDDTKGDIISQYIRFCHVFDEQIRKHGKTRKAIAETIRICQNEDVLREYLQRETEEVMDIMYEIFDDREMLNMYVRGVAREEREQGLEQGRAEREKEIIRNMLNDGLEPQSISHFCGCPLELIREVQESMRTSA